MIFLLVCKGYKIKDFRKIKIRAMIVVVKIIACFLLKFYRIAYWKQLNIFLGTRTFLTYAYFLCKILIIRRSRGPPPSNLNPR